eukprot:5834886-Alexandrium_andersonii.AAC.1
MRPRRQPAAQLATAQRARGRPHVAPQDHLHGRGLQLRRRGPHDRGPRRPVMVDDVVDVHDTSEDRPNLRQ